MKTIAILALTLSTLSTISQADETLAKQIPFDLGDTDKRILKMRIRLILEKDQQFRSYMSYGTTDDAEIERINKLDMKGQLKAMSEKRKLSPEVTALLRQLQMKNDKENYVEFSEIVREYGYPSKERLGTKADSLFVLLLHPPLKRDEIESHIQEMSKLLMPEVRAGRMKPKFFAMFVDNMRGKILRQPQVYGTNQQFDRATGKVLPPRIEDLDKANAARREIGLPELKAGEYRLTQKAE